MWTHTGLPLGPRYQSPCHAPATSAATLFLGGEVDLVGRVATRSTALLAGACAGSPQATCAGGASGGLHVLGGGLVAGALEGGLCATGAGGLLSCIVKDHVSDEGGAVGRSYKEGGEKKKRTRKAERKEGKKREESGGGGGRDVCLPQTQESPPLPQQVVGFAVETIVIFGGGVDVGC